MIKKLEVGLKAILSSYCTVFEGNFSEQAKFEEVGSIWDYPKNLTDSSGQSLKILEGYFSFYNSCVLQPLCNIRNQCLNDQLADEGKRKAISALCAGGMILSVVTIGFLELVGRLALSIIGSPALIVILCLQITGRRSLGDHCFIQLVMFGLGGTFFNYQSCRKAVLSAGRCFDANCHVYAYAAKKKWLRRW